MKERLDALLAKPAMQHLKRALTRFGERNGSLLAASVTYFSVLSIVPVLMFSFAVLGLMLTFFLQDQLSEIRQLVLDQLGGGDIADKIEPIIDKALSNWASGGIVASVIALGLALWSGTAWVGNLRRAVQTMWLEDPVEDRPSRSAIAEILVNMGTFLMLLLLTFVTFVVSTAVVSFNATVVGWLGFTNVAGMGLLFGLIGLLVTVVASTVMFIFLFRVLPGQRAARRELLLGSLGAGVALTILQSLANVVAGLFSGNVAASVFGPVIILMLFLNLYATIIMIFAAWIGTAHLGTETESVSGETGSDPRAESEPRLGPWPNRATGELFSEDKPDNYPRPDPDIYIPQDVAAKGVKVSGVIGYGLGAVTGLGVGAFFAGLAKGLFHRER